MELVNGLFVLISAVLFAAGMLFGFVICNSINRNTERQRQTTDNQNQLDRIENGVRQAMLSSAYLSWISLSVAAVAVGGAGLEIPVIGRSILVGLGILVILGTGIRIAVQRRRGII